MSSLFSKVEPALANLLIDTIGELAEYAWHKLTGQSDSQDSDVVTMLKTRAFQALARALQDEAEVQAALLALPVVLDKLHTGADSVLEAFETAGGRGLGSLPMETMTEAEVIAAKAARLSGKEDGS